MAALKHVHTYVRLKKGIYKCDDPLCTHTAHKDLIVGKMTKCSQCRTREFVLTYEDLKRSKPLCPSECSMRTEHVETRERAKLLSEMFEVQEVKDQVNQ